MFQFSLPAEVGQSVSIRPVEVVPRAPPPLNGFLPMRTRCALLTGNHCNTAGDAVFFNFPCSAEVAMRRAAACLNCAYFEKAQAGGRPKVYSSDMWTSTDGTAAPRRLFNLLKSTVFQYGL